VPNCRYAGFLKSTLAQHGGLEKVTGLVSDREAVCVRTSEDLQKEAPHLVLVYCQGHGELLQKMTGYAAEGTIN
jgi:hypothetical protein